MARLTIRGFRTRRTKVGRRRSEFERRRAKYLVPSRQGFKVHLSYFGRSGKIVFRGNRWMLGELAPPLPPPAIHEAERLIAAMPGGISRAEIEAELKARSIPYTAKSLQTQLSERLRSGALIYTDGRYAFPQVQK